MAFNENENELYCYNENSIFKYYILYIPLGNNIFKIKNFVLKKEYCSLEKIKRISIDN